MAVRCGELQLICSIGQTQKKKQDAALFRMAREERLRAFQNGSQIEEDAALKERRTNRDRELF